MSRRTMSQSAHVRVTRWAHDLVALRAALAALPGDDDEWAADARKALEHTISYTVGLLGREYDWGWDT